MTSPLWVLGHCSHPLLPPLPWAAVHLSWTMLLSSWEVCTHPFRPARAQPASSQLPGDHLLAPPLLSLNAMAQPKKHPGLCLKYLYGYLFTSNWLWEIPGESPSSGWGFARNRPSLMRVGYVTSLSGISTQGSGVFPLLICTHSSDFSEEHKHTSTPRFLFKIAHWLYNITQTSRFFQQPVQKEGS